MTAATLVTAAPVSTADRIADVLLNIAHERGEPISPCRAHRLMYVAQGWHLAFEGRPLFAEPIEAWINGPGLPAMRRRFGRFYDAGPRLAEPHDVSDVAPAARAICAEVWDAYETLDDFAWMFELFEEPPWLKARHGLLDDESGRGRVINPNDLAAYFKAAVIVEE